MLRVGIIELISDFAIIPVVNWNLPVKLNIVKLNLM